MRFLKSAIYFFLAVIILLLSGMVAYAKHDQVKMKYRGMDNNHNGVITLKEWRGNKNSFSNQDWNGDGVLSGNERVPGAHRPKVGTDRFVELDYNNNGFVSLEEWNNTVRSFNQLDGNHDGRLIRDEFYNRQQYPVSAFRELDQNNNGRITLREWRSTAQIFNDLDTNKDNVLSETEFNTRQGSGLVERVFRDIFNWR